LLNKTLSLHQNNLMKTINKLILVVILLISNLTYSQDCIYEFDGYSKIHKGYIKTTKKVKYQAELSSISMIQFTKQKYNDSTYNINFELIVTRPEYLAVDKNSYVSFLLETGETVTIFYAGGLNQGSINTNASNLFFSLTINKETLTKLSNTLIANISIKTAPKSGGYFNQDLKKKRKLQLQKSINCILNAKF